MWALREVEDYTDRTFRLELADAAGMCQEFHWRRIKLTTLQIRKIQWIDADASNHKLWVKGKLISLVFSKFLLTASWVDQQQCICKSSRGKTDTLLQEPNTWGFRKPEGINWVSRTSEYLFETFMSKLCPDYKGPAWSLWPPLVRVWFSGEALLCPRQSIITVITAGPRFWADLAISTAIEYRQKLGFTPAT